MESRYFAGSCQKVSNWLSRVASNLNVFFVALSRGVSGIREKVAELQALGHPFLIVSGDKVDLPNVVYREPKGKFDAINFSLHYIPNDTDVVAFNDVDTTIHNADAALRLISNENVALVFVRVNVEKGPQLTFYSILDMLRKRIPIAASGELLLIKYDLLQKIMPLRPCKAEDSYILFKSLEAGGKTVFCEDTYVVTKRTTLAREEEDYKRRTVGGIYQALSMTKPPLSIRLFYTLLPFLSSLLIVFGKKGYYWNKGILLGFVDYLRGDKAASWIPAYS